MPYSAVECWSRALNNISLKLGQARFDTWFGNIKFISCENGTLVIGVPNLIIRDWLQQRYASALLHEFQEIFGAELTIELKISPELFAQAQERQLEQSVEVEEEFRKREKPNSVQPRADFTLDRFVVGECNQLAYNACKSIAEQTVPLFNPLFIYGQSGLGKTHLLHGIWTAMMQKSPDIKLAYLSCEEFTNRYIKGVMSKRLDEFRHSLRRLDVLILDDVHFLASKESTQSEFFHTFDELYNRGKQIIISSDAPPMEIKELASKLRMRFLSGLLAKLDYPDANTRLRILQKKALERKFVCSTDIMELLAQHLRGNVRELEGALTRIMAYVSLTKETLNMDLARKLLKEYAGPSSPAEKGFDRILTLVAGEYGIKPKLLTGAGRSQQVAEARHLAILLARELSESSLNEIGKLFGGRNHSTIVHALKNAGQKIVTDKDFAVKYEKLKSLLDDKS